MTKTLKLPKVSVKALYPTSALSHGHNETLQMRTRHNNRIIRAGGKYKKLNKKKRKTRKNRKKKGGNKSCGCGNTPTAVVAYPAGSSSSMSPNPNANIQSAQQQFANSACASTGDAMGDTWSQTGGSDLGKFIENLNNMTGGKRRTKMKRKRKKRRKKQSKTKKIRLTRYSKLR